MEKLKIEYYGHACFRLTYGGQRIVLDPYADGAVPGYGNLRMDAEFIYCSHEHGDHSAADVITKKPCDAPNFKLEELLVDHDPAGGTLRGKCTIRIFTFGTLRVAHFADLGRALTAQEAEKLKGLDCAMIPVGGHFTIDSVQAKAIIDELKPRVVIPMHYRSETAGYGVIAPLDDFLGLFDGDTPDILPLTVGGWAELG